MTLPAAAIVTDQNTNRMSVRGTPERFEFRPMIVEMLTNGKVAACQGIIAMLVTMWLTGRIFR